MLNSSWINLKTTLLPPDCCTDKSEADAQVYGNLSSDKKKAIMPSRHQTGEKVFNYKISRGRERGNRFKGSHFISSLLEKASLIVPSEWAVFPQMHLDDSGIGSWRGVPSFTKYGGKPFSCRPLNRFSNGVILK